MTNGDTMTRYRTRPVEVEAMQAPPSWTGDAADWDALVSWAKERNCHLTVTSAGYGRLFGEGLELSERSEWPIALVHPGDWVVHGGGTCFVKSAEEFAAGYEELRLDGTEWLAPAPAPVDQAAVEESREAPPAAKPASRPRRPRGV